MYPKQFAAGFCGGLIAAVLLACIDAFSHDLEKHALLSAPFLSFLALLLLLALFHKPISLLMRRENVTIEWGDKKIAFQEISDEIDKDISSYLDDLGKL